MNKTISALVLSMAVISLACDVGTLVQQAAPSPTLAVQASVPTSAATTTSVPGSNETTATVPLLPTVRAGVTPSILSAPIPPGWQLVKYSKDESCTVAVPADWKVDARISSALKTDANFTNGTVSVALANTTDWEKFKKTQTDARPGDKAIESSTTRLWLDGVGDGKTTQLGSFSTYLAVRAADGKICVAIIGTDGKAAPSWRDVLTAIAKTVAFR